MEYFSFALRNLQRKGIRSWLTLLGICIGIAAVVSLISLGDGLKLAVSSQFGISKTELITVTAGGSGFSAPGSDVVNPLTKDDVRAIGRISSVDFAIPRNIETISVDFNDKLLFTSATSIPDGDEKKLYQITDLKTISGRLLKEGDSNKILIGNSLSLGSKNGLDKDIRVGNKVSIMGRNFTVAGILKKQGSFIVDGVVFMLDSDMKILGNYRDNVDIISVKVKNKDLINRTKTDIEKLMRERRNVKIGGEDFTVSTPEASLAQINQILTAIQIFVAIIAFISIIIGAFGIANTMTTSVLERKKEIGIMKAIGAKNSQIFMQFFIESGFLGVVGGVLGIAFGAFLGYVGTFEINNFFGSEASPKINFLLISVSLFGSFLIGVLSGIFPAMKAAKQNPVRALYE
jgi:putative ABC transport system permease protein